MDLTDQLLKTAKAMNEVTRIQARERTHEQNLLVRITSLRSALVDLLKLVEDTQCDSEGRYPIPNDGCIECTIGTVPDRLNKGLCPIHRAKKLLEY
jgi:hypothetical protein